MHIYDFFWQTINKIHQKNPETDIFVMLLYLLWENSGDFLLN